MRRLNLRVCAAVLTALMGMAAGFLLALLFTEENMDFGLRKEQYVLVLLLSLLLPHFFYWIGSLLPLVFSKRLIAVWWLGFGLYKSEKRVRFCRNKAAQSWVVLVRPLTVCEPNQLPRAWRSHRRMLLLGAVTSAISLIIPVVWIWPALTHGMPWPVYCIPLLYLTGWITCILSAFSSAGMPQEALWLARRFYRFELPALSALWWSTWVLTPERNDRFLHELCLRELKDKQPDSRTLQTAEALLTAHITLNRIQPLPPEMESVVQEITDNPADYIVRCGAPAVRTVYYLFLYNAGFPERHKTAAALYRALQTCQPAPAKRKRGLTDAETHLVRCLKEIDVLYELADEEAAQESKQKKTSAPPEIAPLSPYTSFLPRAQAASRAIQKRPPLTNGELASLRDMMRAASLNKE
jgi:hypothetical protein